MITDNIVAEFKDLDDAKHMVQVTPTRWGMETVIGIYKTEHGEHQNYYYALFYSNQELNDNTEIVLTNNTMGIGQPPIRRTLKWLNENHHTVFKLSDLIKEIEGK
jgi:ATP-dependent Zn protease